MTSSIKIAPPYSLIFIADSGRGEIPERMDRPVTSTDSCIVVGCLAAVDGETEFTLGETRDVDRGDPPVFHGLLKTPNCRIVLHTAEDETILQATVPRRETVVRIWVNHPSQPDRVIVGLG
jgi:hypothetical protein